MNYYLRITSYILSIILMGTQISAAAYRSNTHFVWNVRFERDRMVIAFVDGNELPVPLAWYPQLHKATPRQLSQWRLAGDGLHIHWPELNADISLESLLH